MQTTVFARGRILPRAHEYSSALLTVKRPDQKILDLGLALFERADTSVGVRDGALDFGDVVLERGHVGFELPLPVREFSLIGSECVDGRQNGSIVGLAGLQGGHSCFQVIQSRHGCSLSSGAGLGSRECGRPALGRNAADNSADPAEGGAR